MTKKTESAGRRAAAYWFVDGLEEIVFGLLFLIPGVGVIAFDLNYLQHWWMALLIFCFFVGFWILFWADRQILDFLKARFTYPRTGYARPPQNPEPDQDVLVDFILPDKRRRELLTLYSARPLDENVTSFRARTVFLFLAANMVAQWFPGRGSVALIMVAVAALVFGLNRGEVHPYAWWSVLPIALAGLLSAAVEIPPASRQVLPFIIGGGWLLAQGGWTFVRYLRTHPRPKEPERVHL